MEEHWPRSASAKRPCCRYRFREHLRSDRRAERGSHDWGVWGSQVKRKTPHLRRGFLNALFSMEPATVVAVRRPLPLYANKRTLRRPVGTSQNCQQRKWSFRLAPNYRVCERFFGRTLTHLTDFFMTLSTTTATCQLYPMQTIAAVSSFCTKMSTVSLSTSPQTKPRNNRS